MPIRNRLLALVLLGCLAGPASGDGIYNGASIANAVGVGYAPSRLYTLTPTTIAVASAIATLDTVIYATPIIVTQEAFPAVSLNVRVTATGTASCAIKMAIFANSTTTKRPTGTALAGSNTGTACATASTTVTLAVSITLQPGTYWFVESVTTGASTFISAASGDTNINTMIGRSTITGTTTITGLSSTSQTYSSNFTTMDLTAATWTDVTGNAGIPLLFLGS